jgi:hypothetical protein
VTSILTPVHSGRLPPPQRENLGRFSYQLSTVSRVLTLQTRRYWKPILNRTRAFFGSARVRVGRLLSLRSIRLAQHVTASVRFLPGVPLPTPDKQQPAVKVPGKANRRNKGFPGSA